MKIDPDEFHVAPSAHVKLDKRPTLIRPLYKSNEHYQELLGRHAEDLRSLQNVLYASNRCALLVIFQAMDAAGKDGMIKHVMSGVNPQGCQVYSFQHPSAEELKHDFLWRCACLDDAEKNWKFSMADIEERRRWKDYMQAYQACLRATSKRHAPWYVVPSDDKPNARLIVSQIIVDTLRGLHLEYPRLDAKRRRELQAIRRLLVAKRV